MTRQFNCNHLIMQWLPLACLLLVIPAHAAEIDDHPLISRYEGSTPTRRDEDEFQQYKLITGVVADSLDFDYIDLAGHLTQIGYQNPEGRSPLEILANYKMAITGAGGTIIYTCQEKECGPAYAGSRWGRFNGMIHLSAIGGYVAGRIDSEGTTAYIAIGVAKRRHKIAVIEITEMETGLVQIDPDALGQELDLVGHVTIPGIYFEYGKADLTEQSQEALEAMKVILGARPEMSAWIVGHTDWTGDFDFNMNLSNARARSVATALISRYGIDKNRLESRGAGPLAPRATNNKESGRAMNRRVELVAKP